MLQRLAATSNDLETDNKIGVGRDGISGRPPLPLFEALSRIVELLRSTDVYHACEFSQCTTHMCAINAQYCMIRGQSPCASVCTNLYTGTQSVTAFRIVYKLEPYSGCLEVDAAYSQLLQDTASYMGLH